ncbi:MAG: hypothetical protein JO297_19445 [Nitrososphaeraceae archaeon]|nr:hypothetical protein [Nitrososphaeraceae archaeon]
MIISSAQGNYDDDPSEAEFRSMIKRSIAQISSPDLPSILGHSSSTTIKKISQPTEHEE